MTEFDPFDIPGYEELEEEFQAAWETMVRRALPVADIAIGIAAEYSPETIERLQEQYRAENERFIRAREIRDQCYEGYLGDSRY